MKRRGLKKMINKPDGLNMVIELAHDKRVMIDAFRHLWQLANSDSQDNNMGYVDKDPFYDDNLNNWLEFCHNAIVQLKKK